jgi:DNA-3-methyladenine glycosylase II
VSKQRAGARAKAIAAGLDHLRASDPVLRRVIDRVGPFQIRLERDRFRALVRSIVWQQISGRAASAIYERLLKTLAARELPLEHLDQLAPHELRAAGLSAQKMSYLLDLATKTSTGQVQLQTLGRLTDEAVVERLCQIKGIGIWTAQMFLIFSLGRLNVFPFGDLGVRGALRNLYGLDDLPDRGTSEQLARRWQPYCTLGSWYCWRSLELKGEREEPDSGAASIA